MGNYDLSVIIAARNEQFLPNTVEDVLKNRHGRTEVIIIADESWPNPPVADHPDVTLVHAPVSIGQRGAVNLGARLSKSLYIMKSDAHVAFDEGFDVKLMKDCEPNWLVVPRLYNLHVFNWLCTNCGVETYQGPKLTHCTSCDKDAEFEMKMVWQPRWSRVTDSMRWDHELHFQYFRDFHPQEGIAAVLRVKGLAWLQRLCDASVETADDSLVGDIRSLIAEFDELPIRQKYQHRREAIKFLAHIRSSGSKTNEKRLLSIISSAQSNILDTMSLLGACWFLRRDFYWDVLGGLDEGHGSWGAMGTELSAKLWTSGNRLVVNRATFYSHLFRTSSGFSFPYRLTSEETNAARNHSKDIWFNNKWSGQVYPLSRVVERFYPCPDWDEKTLAQLKSAEANSLRFGRPNAV